MRSRRMPVELKDSLQNYCQISNGVRIPVLGHEEEINLAQLGRDEDVEIHDKNRLATMSLGRKHTSNL